MSNIIYNKEPLYKRTASGKISTINIYTDGKTVYRNTNGKITTIQIVPKSNRTLKEQALLQTDSEFKKKLRNGYKTDINTSTIDPQPMLAKTLKEEYITFPAGVSPKLDGVRALAYNDEERIIIRSRTGKEFKFKEKLKEQIGKLKIDDIILDGELYVHNMPFPDIMKLVSPSKNRPQEEDVLKYHIFDLIAPGSKATYRQRMDRMEKVEEEYHNIIPREERLIKFVYYDVAQNMKDIDRLHDIYAEKGYEGVMIRNLESLYREGFRSKDLLKYKKFEDKEFKIIDYKEGTGNDKGAIIFIVKNDIDDRTFAVRPKLPIDERKRMFKRGKQYIGEMYTVRYQPLEGNNDLPRFPVGIAIRDYE